LAYVQADDARPVASRNAADIEDSWPVWLPAIAPKTFTSPFEWFHAKLLDWYWALLSLRAASEEIPENLPLAGLLALGRGLGKSTILEAIALAEGAHIPRSFGVYISSTQDKAKEHLASIRDLIESSEIAHYYPGLANPRLGKFGDQRGWRAEAVYNDSGFGIVAASLEQGIRGLRDSEIRPTFILLDLLAQGSRAVGSAKLQGRRERGRGLEDARAGRPIDPFQTLQRFARSQFGAPDVPGMGTADSRRQSG
jgi:hypothetical protein